MKIAAVQIKSLAGNISANVKQHIDLIESSAAQGTDLIYFPELSITGYEPTMAKSLAMKVDNPVFDVFQKLSDSHDLIIGVGAPLLNKDQVFIGMVWFEPNKPRSEYHKQLLDPDELPFFISGDSQLILQHGKYQIAPAICYESIQTSHAGNAVELGANIYLASVAMSSTGVERAKLHYSEIAKQHKQIVVLSNYIGPCDNFIGAGHSAAWNHSGNLLAQLEGDSEGLLIVDTVSCNAVLYNHN